MWQAKAVMNLRSKLLKPDNFSEAFEAKLLPETSFGAEVKEPYSGAFFKPGEGLTASSDTDFLPEMDFKAESMVLVADKNSRKKPVRRSGKSKLLKFSVDPCSEEDEPELIPEPEPEKVSFFQAYPEIDFSAGTEKKKKRKRINEFAYIYGSGGYFEPEPEAEEDDYAGDDDSYAGEDASYAGIWNSETEIEPEAESVIDPGIKRRAEPVLTKPALESAFEAETRTLKKSLPSTSG